MIFRQCPECKNKISLFKTLNLCPYRSYTCPHCATELTITKTSHHILLYGALLSLFPALVYYVIEPSLLSGSTIGGSALFLLALTLTTQKLIPAETKSSQ